MICSDIDERGDRMNEPKTTQSGSITCASAEKTHDRTTGDLIDRQAAIDAYGDWYVEEGTADGLIGTVRQLLDTLPSAQPELIEKAAYIRGFEQGRTQGMIDTKAEEVAQPELATNLQPTCNQLATDCISRRAAIDALNAKSDEIYETKKKGATFPHDDFFQGMAYALDVIKALPSAQPEQPEIIRCKDCGWWTKQSDSLQGRCARYGRYPTGAWYCASAERRKDDFRKSTT